MVLTPTIRVLMASFAMFLQFTKLTKSASEAFAQKNILKIHCYSDICFTCRSMQGVIVLIISNRPHASRLSDFEITHAITPRSGIVLHSFQLLL